MNDHSIRMSDFIDDVHRAIDKAIVRDHETARELPKAPVDGLREAVRAFLAERDNFIRALNNCTSADSDFWRWQGHAEARRVFGEALERDGIDLTAEPGIPADKVLALINRYYRRADEASNHADKVHWNNAGDMATDLFTQDES